MSRITVEAEVWSDAVLEELDTEELIEEISRRGKGHLIAANNLGDDLLEAVLDGDLAKAQSLANLCRRKHFFDLQRKQYAELMKGNRN